MRTSPVSIIGQVWTERQLGGLRCAPPCCPPRAGGVWTVSAGIDALCTRSPSDSGLRTQPKPCQRRLQTEPVHELSGLLVCLTAERGRAGRPRGRDKKSLCPRDCDYDIIPLCPTTSNAEPTYRGVSRTASWPGDHGKYTAGNLTDQIQQAGAV